MDIINKIDGQKKSVLEFLKQGLQNIFNKYINNNSKVWDDMYIRKYENKMNSNEQSDRYVEINNVIINSGLKNSDILDVGSGNGTILEYLDKTDFNSYTGIDISREAVKIANKKYSDFENINFLETDLMTFGGYRFDVIIFNESLYYYKLRDIKNVIQKSFRLLNKNGLIIISMSISLKSFLIRKILNRMAKTESDKIVFSRSSGNKWRIRVYKNQMGNKNEKCY